MKKKIQAVFSSSVLALLWEPPSLLLPLALALALALASFLF
jgi:hypothetical protein